MKNLYKFFLALGVYSTVFSQIPEIKRLPVQEISQSNQKNDPPLLMLRRTGFNKIIKRLK
jgi:hypothetical protein